MGFARFSVTRPVAVMMRIVGLVILGIICLQKLSLALLPNVTIPTVAVVTSWANVAPEQMETQITRPVEEAVSQVPNLYEIDSTSTLGRSIVRIQFNWGTDINAAAVDTLQYAQRAKSSFPQDPTNTLQDPLVFKFDPSSLPILILAVRGIDDPVRLRMLLDNTITPILESANGVASAVATGGLPRAILVDVDPQRLEAFHIPLSLVGTRIADENVSLPGGIAKMGKTEYTIQSTGYFTSPSQIKDVPLMAVNGREILLGDVATVKDQYQEQRVYTRLNGEPAAGVIITEQSNANAVATTQAVNEKLDEIRQLYPELKWTTAYQQATFITDSIKDLENTALIGGFLAVLILMLFLRNVRSTLVVAFSIPISIISSFSLFYFAGFSLNTISLSGLALATGLIVDDAVVVMENIFRHIERDKRRPMDAAVTGTAEIASAVLASTFTVMIVFFPLMMIQGQAGQTFTQFALVVIFSISISWLDAMTVVPMLCSRLISEREVLEEAHPELRQGKPGLLTRVFDWVGIRFHNLDMSYHRGLDWSLKHRLWVLLGAGMAVAATFAILPFIGSEMLPQTDTGNFTVNVKLPVGTDLDTTNQVMKKVENIILADKDVASEFSAAGTTLSIRGTTTSQIGYYGGATVTLKDERKNSTQQNIVTIQKQLAKIPGILATVTPYDIVTQILTGNSTNMEVDVFGQDYNLVTQAAHLVQQKMSQVPGLEAVDLTVQENSPQITLSVNRPMASQLGLSYTDIATALDTATNGYLASYYQELGFQYPIYVEVPPAQRKTLDQLRSLPIAEFVPPSAASAGTSAAPPSPGQTLASNQSAPTTTLGQVADPHIISGVNEVDRQNRQRYMAVAGRVSPSSSDSEVQAGIQKALEGVNLGQGVHWEFGLQQKRRGEEFSGLALAVFMAIALIYVVLASQFESLVYPLIVLCSVPLCGVGVALALFLTGRNFGLTAFIGLLMLVGIAVKNGILLVDYTNQLRGRGMPRNAAILQAGPTRLRPILMTSSAAILGMLPLALQLGKGSETEAPLATAVVGGLFTSTALTLFVVPVVYTLFDDLSRWFRRRKADVAPSEPSVPLVPSGFPNGHSAEASRSGREEQPRE